MNTLYLTRLLQFGDSMLPTGAFAFSGALEAAAQTGAVHSPDTLQQYVAAALRQASTGDATGLAWALRALGNDAACRRGDERMHTMKELCHIDSSLFRRKLPEEFRDMSTRTGRKLAELGAATVRSPLHFRWLSLIKTGKTPGCYPVSLAVLLAASLFADAPSGEEQQEKNSRIMDGLTVYFYGVTMGILNASLRLMRVTHFDVQSILYHVSPLFEECARTAMATQLERMTGYAPMTDILAAVHSEGRVRLFMS